MRRREFLRYGLTCSAFACAGARRVVALRRAPELRLGLLRTASATAATSNAERGAHFGAAEAARTAELLGGSLSLHTDTTDAHAYVRVDSTVQAPADALVLDVFGAGCDDALRLDAPAAAYESVRARGAELARWDASLYRYGAAQLNDRYHAATGTAMEDGAWAGWFAVKVLWESAARVSTITPASLRAHLLSGHAVFDGHKGEPLRFSARGVLLQPFYLLRAGAPPEAVSMNDLIEADEACER